MIPRERAVKFMSSRVRDLKITHRESNACVTEQVTQTKNIITERLCSKTTNKMEIPGLGHSWCDNQTDRYREIGSIRVIVVEMTNKTVVMSIENIETYVELV